MLEVAIGVIAAGVIWLTGRLCVWREIRLFDRNLKKLIERAESSVKNQPAGREAQNEQDDFNSVKKDVQTGYERNKKERLRKVHWGIVLFAITVGYLTFCITYISAGGAYSFLVVLPAPVLVAGVFTFYEHLLNSEKCCVFKSTSAADPGLWLGLILPSISKRGTLRLVLGSMTPFPFSRRWFRDLLVWLDTEKKATIQIVSGKQELEKMDEKQRGEWIKCWGSFDRDFLRRNVHIVPGRPELQYAVTDKLVRVEKDHPSWVVRQQEKKDGPVPNHIRLYNFFLIRAFNMDFDMLWNQGQPTVEDLVTALSNRRSQS
jgi:hypothetical protein